MKIDKDLVGYVWHKYQGLDWCLLVALAIVMGCVTLTVEPHCRSFEWTDASIGYPMKDDTFPNWSLALIVILPFLIFIFGTLFVVPWLQRHLPEPLSLLAPSRFTRRGDPSATTGTELEDDNAKPNVHHTFTGVFGYDVRQMEASRGPLYPWIRVHVWTIVLQFFIVILSKTYAGRLRPDYIDRLRKAGYTASDVSLPDPTAQPQFYCDLMKDHADLKEGRFSFPSGHSSTSFAACMTVCFYLMTHLRPFARQGSFVRLCISFCPLWVAFMCAISRTQDNKHNFSDILAGSLLGIAVAIVCFIVCFREVGGLAGALNIYTARAENDHEYVQWQRVPAYEMREMSKEPNTDAFSHNEATTAVSIDERALGAGDAPTMKAVAPGVPTTSPHLSEKQLNQDPHTVPWL